VIADELEPGDVYFDKGVPEMTVVEVEGVNGDGDLVVVVRHRDGGHSNRLFYPGQDVPYVRKGTWQYAAKAAVPEQFS
jgi:hypothetical protein